MDIYSSSIDLMRAIFLVGAVLALLYKKRFGVTPGGIIVPGLLTGVIFQSFIAFMVMTINTLLCWLIYKYVVSNFALSNRWTALVNISISVIISLAAMAVVDTYHLLHQETLLISMVIPGLITISAKKYGIGRVLYACGIVTAAVSAVALLLANVIPYNTLSFFSTHLSMYKPLELTYPLIALPISLLAAILIYYRFGIRGGGYLISPFLAVVFITAPIQGAMVAGGIAISYLIVRIVQRFTLIIGLERFVLSLFCAYFLVSIMDLIAIKYHLASYRPTPLILIIAIAVFTNDLTLQSAPRTVQKGMVPALLTSVITRLAI